MRKATIALLFILSAIIFISCESVSGQKLEAPQLVLTEKRIEWEIVANAEKYEIVTEEKTITTTNTVFYFGEYIGEVKVRCLGDGKTYLHSDYAVVKVRGK